MSDFLLAHETGIRVSVSAGLFAVFATAETLRPARPRSFRRRERWPANVFLAILDTAILRLLFPLLAVGAAVWAESAHFGLFNRMDVPYWGAVTAAVVILDGLIYGQHVALHRIGPLWRLHRVHHTDKNVDATTALRFHPGEVALSMGLKMTVVVLLGAPPASVVVFETLLNGMAMFNHANLRLASRVENLLRLFVVTPAMHRIHHSQAHDETDSNYGFNLSIWDRVLGTYRASAHDPLFPLGLPSFGSANTNSVFHVVLLPFKRGALR